MSDEPGEPRETRRSGSRKPRPSAEIDLPASAVRALPDEPAPEASAPESSATPAGNEGAGPDSARPDPSPDLSSTPPAEPATGAAGGAFQPASAEGAAVERPAGEPFPGFEPQSSAAQELPPAQELPTGQEPAPEGRAPEPTAGMPPPPPPEARRSLALPLLAAVLAGGVAGLAAGFLPSLMTPQTPDAPAVAPQRVTLLEQRLEEVRQAQASQPAATPAPAPDIAPLQQRLQQTGEDVTALRSRADTLASELASTRQALEGEIAGARETLTKLESAVAAAREQGNAPAPEVQSALGSVRQRIAELERRQQIPDPRLADLDPRLAALDQRLAAVEPQVGSAQVGLRQANEAVAAANAKAAALEASVARLTGSDARQTAAARLAAVGAAIRAFERGEPLGQAIEALARLGVEDARLAPLRAYAGAGAPSPAALLARFDAGAAGLKPAQAPSPSGNVIDRLAAGAWSLVEVRPVGEPAGSDDPAVAARTRAALARGDMAAAARLAEELSPQARPKVSDVIAAAQARAEASAALRALEGDAVAALAKQ